MQITVTFSNGKESINLLIDNRQKIRDTLNTIDEISVFPDFRIETVCYVKSLRMNRRLSVFCSYEEAGIYSGDIVEICNTDK